MKNFILGLAIVGLAISCKNNENNEISDAANVNAPEGACASECATECETSCEDKSSECDADATECTEAQVCPVTGESIN